MHTTAPITDTVHWVGVNDWQTTLFESLWPLPYGISYNSYLILDEQVALIDTVKEDCLECYLEKIQQLLPEEKGIDYLIVNHMEPDHSGAIGILKKFYPEMKIIGNKQTKRFLDGFFGITEDVQAVAEGETLDLGEHVLQFTMTPMVHWPETMMTYLTGDKILFSGDAFGTFGALTGGVFDDEVQISWYEDETLRYFSNIVGKYSRMTQKALKKLDSIPLNVIASTHGPVWRRNPQRIVEIYDHWSRHKAEEGVTIVYGSMYGNTTRMMEAVARGISETGISNIYRHDVSVSHPSFVIRDAWRNKGIVLGGPTYDQGLFPSLASITDFLGHKELTGRVAGVFGNYGWSGGAVNTLSQFVENREWENVDPIVEVNCTPTSKDLEECRMLGRHLAERVGSP